MALRWMNGRPMALRWMNGPFVRRHDRGLAGLGRADLLDLLRAAEKRIGELEKENSELHETIRKACSLSPEA